jgi:hypothetical protein
MLSEWLNTTNPEKEEPERPATVMLMEWEYVKSQTNLRERLLTEFHALPNILHRVEVVPERGWKCRVVTKSPASLVSLCNVARKHLFRGIRRDPSIRSVLLAETKKGIEEIGARAGPFNRILSADLKAASDRIPRELAQALLEGLIDAKVWPSWLDEVARASVGDADVIYPDGSTVKQTCGILMGLPLTWSLLCLTQLFWVTESIRDFHKQPFCRAVPCPFVICGDDLAAIWPLGVIERYESLAQSCGAAFSVGKHFHSLKGGVFVELTFRVERDEKDYGREPSSAMYTALVTRNPKILGVKVLDLLPLRGLVEPSTDHTRVESRLPDGLPDALSIGFVTRALRGQGVSEDRLRAVFKTLWSHCIKAARKEGMYPYLPIEFGGLGYPCKRGLDVPLTRLAPRFVRRAIAVYLSHHAVASGGCLGTVLRNSIEEAWRGLALDEANSNFKENFKVFWNSEAFASFLLEHPNWVSLDCKSPDLVEQMAGFQTKNLTLMLGPQPTRRKSIRHKSRALWGDLVKLWPAVNPMKATLRTCLLRLKEIRDSEVVAVARTPDNREGYPDGFPFWGYDYNRTLLSGAFGWG